MEHEWLSIIAQNVVMYQQLTTELQAFSRLAVIRRHTHSVCMCSNFSPSNDQVWIAFVQVSSDFHSFQFAFSVPLSTAVEPPQHWRHSDCSSSLARSHSHQQYLTEGNTDRHFLLFNKLKEVQTSAAVKQTRGSIDDSDSREKVDVVKTLQPFTLDTQKKQNL